jgi:Dynein heavy chain, N-terminal region 1
MDSIVLSDSIDVYCNRLTDAINDTKDKVRFLESLERHFEQFYNGTSPAALLGTVLPSLVNAIVSVESVSKFYAQQGFLGLLFTKVGFSARMNLNSAYLWEIVW